MNAGSLFFSLSQLGDGERSLGFIIPPLLRVLDVPQGTDQTAFSFGAVS